MFSILQKPKDSVNAEDLETLQNEIEHRLVDIVAQKWELERELNTLYSTSPDSATHQTNSSAEEGINKHSSSNTATTTQSSNHSNVGLPSGKLRNSLKQSLNEPDITSDGFKGSQCSSNNNTNGSGGANSNETDSVSSESSLVSNVTGSTIINAALPDSGSHLNTANSSNNKRSLKSSSGDRPSKRFRQDSSNSLRSTGSFPKRPPHCKHRPKVVPSKYRNSLEESRPNKLQVQKNEAPDKLWPFVEQFCVTPTEEQMKELEEMIRAIDNDKEFYKIPTLGKKDGVVVKDSPSKNDSTSNKRKSKSKSKADDDSSLGALTQRLVSSFIEETEEIGTDGSKSSSDSPPAKKKKTKANKGIDLNEAKNLEKRIRQQLEEYSILSQQDDIPYTSEEDEVLRELLAHQHELLTIQTQNKLYMQLLLKKAKRHIQLEKERERLKEASADVIAAYVRLIHAKQRKRIPTKKEKDAACKALKVHEAVFKKCDDLYMSSSDRNGSV